MLSIVAGGQFVRFVVNVICEYFMFKLDIRMEEINKKKLQNVDSKSDEN
jgi:hypothetical protein